MALHDKNSIRQQIDDEIYSSVDLSVSMPKYRFPATEQDPRRLLMTPEAVLKRCDENTIGVVPTLRVTFTGQFEPVAAVAEALDRYQEQTGLDIPLHVDGASGGFLAPFCAPDLV